MLQPADGRSRPNELNKYKQPQTDEDVKAKKTWTDADNYNPKPEIKFELWRKNGTAGAGEKVVDATALTNNEVNFGKQLKTDINGVEYTYFVKEIFTNAEENDGSRYFGWQVQPRVPTIQGVPESFLPGRRKAQLNPSNNAPLSFHLSSAYNKILLYSL